MFHKVHVFRFCSKNKKSTLNNQDKESDWSIMGLAGSLLSSLIPQWPLLDKNRYRWLNFTTKTKRLCDCLILVKSSHTELYYTSSSLPQNPYNPSMLYTHNIEDNNAKCSQLAPFTGDTITTVWLAYWLPKLDAQYSQLSDESLQRKEQAEKEQSLAHNPYPTLPCNFSIPWADSLSAQPRLPVHSQGHCVRLVSNASSQLPLT